MEQQDNTFTILENEIFYFDSLGDLSPAFLAKTGYNAVLHCRKGSVDVSLADGRHIAVNSRQLLLIPAYKMTGPVTTSNDVIGGILFISDKMLKSLLGKQINIWNKAIYVDETFLIDGGDWLMDFGQYTHALFRRKHMSLFDEIVRSYMRTLLLSFCEELAQKSGIANEEDRSTGHEKAVFDHFLSLLAANRQKRLTVAQCASELHITPKYLSTAVKRISGRTAVEWIENYVTMELRVLLKNSTKSIKEITEELNFPNQSFLGKYFKEHVGLTPTAYRKS